MTYYSKSLEDYFRIPILLKNITPISQKASKRLTNLLYYKLYPLIIDQNYIRQTSNSNTDILKNRQNVTQKLYFIPEDFNNDWPEYQVTFKAKFALGIIDQVAEQKQIQQILSKVRNENGVKLIGVLNLGTATLQNLFKKQNIIKCSEMSDEQFLHFIQPWLYNCLSIIESQICNIICESKKEDESNRTIVFNRMQQKFDLKIMKKKKKYRCIKLCGDYNLMLHLYKQAFQYFNQAEQNLKKIDDYLWVLGCLQGKIACLIICPKINLPDRQQYIEELINQTYTVSKKTKNWHFQCENYFKIAKLHTDQPQKIDQLMRNFLVNSVRALTQDQRFLVFTTIGNIYQKSGFMRKKNYYYFLAAMIHFNKKSQVSPLLLIEIQKNFAIKQWPQLYKRVLQQIIAEQRNQSKNQFYLQLLSKCASQLSQTQISTILSQLNFSNNQTIHLQHLQFLQNKELYALQSSIKPKQNRIGNRQSPRKVGGAFFMSWKKQQNLLFQQNQQITLKGSIVNKIAFPIRVKISFQIHALSDKAKICSNQQIYMFLQPSSVHKFESKIKAKGQTEQIWVIDKIQVSMWNFCSEIHIPSIIKYQIYQKQPQIDLDSNKILQLQESSNLSLDTQLKVKNYKIPFSLIKINVSIYYNIDVGFQENEIVLRETDQFMGINFNNKPNLTIFQSQSNDIDYKQQNGVLILFLKKFKCHRKNINRIELTLQYIRSLNTKFQISKQYIIKCNFTSQLSYQIEEITTPIIERIYKNKNEVSKIIEGHYKIKLRVNKSNINNNQSYIITYNNQIYKLKNSLGIMIQQIKPKIDNKTIQQEIKEVMYWQCENTKMKGQIAINIPIKQIMKKSLKNVKISLKQQMFNSHKKLSIEYNITSIEQACLSHHIVFNPVQFQRDRMYVLRGKSKCEAKGIELSNKIQCIFSQKCKNSYQIGIIFTDGEIYWHQDLIHINKI